MMSHPHHIISDVILLELFDGKIKIPYLSIVTSVIYF